MISMLVFQGVGMGRRVWEGIDRVATTEEAIEGAQEALRGRIEQMYPATLYGGDEAQTDINGQADTLEFLAPPDDTLRARAPSAISSRADRGRASWCSRRSATSISARDTRITRQVLLTGVQQIDLSYYGAAVGRFAAKQWRSEWFQQVMPPELVRVRVAFGRGDRRSIGRS